MTKTSHELLKQERKENEVIEYVKKAGKTSILRYYVLKYCLTTGHFPKTILTRYCNNIIIIIIKIIIIIIIIIFFFLNF